MLTLAACRANAAQPSPAARPSILATSPSHLTTPIVPPAPTEAASVAQGSTSIQVADAAVTHGNRLLPEVALTFNVGAGSLVASEVIDILRDEHVPATFFVMGWLARRSPEIVRTLADSGFEIGSHGDQVADLTQVGDAAVVGDLDAADTMISGLTGRSTRPLWSPSAAAQDARVRRLAAAAGWDTIVGKVDSGDWRTDASEGAVEAAVLPALDNGAIVILHLDSPHSRDATVPALRTILAALQSRGLRPVTISTLLLHLQGTPATP